MVDERSHAIREMTGSVAGPSGPRPVKAPMPGLVVKLEVAVGDEVVAGQGLVIVEAMKMENELKVEAPGASGPYSWQLFEVRSGSGGTKRLTEIFIVNSSSKEGAIETVKEAKGQGAKRVYQHSYEVVYNATLAAAMKQKLEIVEGDKSAKRIVLSHGITWLSWGERIAIFLKPKTANSTEVEIVSKPILSPLNFPPDWNKILLDQIDVELRSNK